MLRSIALYIYFFCMLSGVCPLSGEHCFLQIYQSIHASQHDRKVVNVSVLGGVGLARFRRTELTADTSDASTSASFDCSWTSLSNLL